MEFELETSRPHKEKKKMKGLNDKSMKMSSISLMYKRCWRSLNLEFDQFRLQISQKIYSHNIRLQNCIG